MIKDTSQVKYQPDSDIMLTMRESVHTERNILDKENNCKNNSKKRKTISQLSEIQS